MSDVKPSWEKSIPRDTKEGEIDRNRLLYVANSSIQMKAFPQSIKTEKGQLIRGKVDEWTENSMFKINLVLIVSDIKVMGNELTEYFKLVLKLANSKEIEDAILSGVLSLETLLRPREFDFPEEVLDSLILGPKLNSLVSKNSKHILEIGDMTKQQNKVLYQIMREIIQLQRFIDKKVESYEKYIEYLGKLDIHSSQTAYNFNVGGKPKQEILELIVKRFEHIERQIEGYGEWLGDLGEILIRK